MESVVFFLSIFRACLQGVCCFESIISYFVSCVFFSSPFFFWTFLNGRESLAPSCGVGKYEISGQSC